MDRERKREVLEEARWRLLNSFGWGPFHDAEVAERIRAIEARLTKLESEGALR